METKQARPPELHVACTKRVQPATFEDENATGTATAHATVSVKRLAHAVLARNSKCNTSATVRENTCNFGAESNVEKLHLPQPVFKSLVSASRDFNSDPIDTYVLVKTAAGPDLREVQQNPKLMDSVARSVLSRRLREQGKVPDSYSKLVECSRCGPVYLWESAPDKLLSCPWCFNRLKGLPIPRPK